MGDEHLTVLRYRRNVKDGLLSGCVIFCYAADGQNFWGDQMVITCSLKQFNFQLRRP